MDERGLKRFSGEEEDAGKALKKWQAWALAKMLTVKDLQKVQRGPWLFTLLDGKALEACEHLKLEDIAKEDGDTAIWKLLKARFPEKELHDQLREVLGEVFGLAAKDGESMKEWTARVLETFERCRRKASVDFPTEARGWIMLHCAGFTEEQKATVKAKTQGSLDMETVSAGIRSCFPTYKASNHKVKKPTTVLLADEMPEEEAPPSETAFDDVEAFLADHHLEMDGAEDPLSETEAAEALAVSWKERRAEINRLNKSRQFGAADNSKRSFRIEVEELKRRTRCRKCGRLGHWARECRAKTNAAGQPLAARSSGGTSSGGSSNKPQNNETLYVETATDDASEGVQDPVFFVGAAEEVMATSLVSSPGKGVIDSGCGKTLIGEETLGRKVIRSAQRNSFRFGNGATEDSSMMARIPVAIGGKTGVIDAAIIRGRAPLLLGRPTLERLDVVLNFREGTITMLGEGDPVKLTRNDAGQFLVDLVQFPVSRQEVLCMPEALIAEVPDVAPSLGVPVESKSGGTPKIGNVPKPYPNPEEASKPESSKLPKIRKKDERRLLTQWKRQPPSQEDGASAFAVAELFSPPRFRLEAERQGYRGLSFDVLQGWDLLDPQTQVEVDRLLDRARPELLVVCPPCKHMGGWRNLNASKLSPLERARLIREARAQARFAADQCQKQIKRGGRFLFEHPWGSRIWKFGPVKTLVRRYGVQKIEQCAYGLCDPDTQLPYLKATGLILNDPNIQAACRKCPGHKQHQVIEGTCATGEHRSTIAGRYPQKFVQSFLKPILQDMPECLFVFAEASEAVSLQGYECLAGAEEASGSQAVAEPMEVGPNQEGNLRSKESPLDPIGLALKKLHNNLGHPAQASFLRVLRNSGASEEALKRAGTFRCPTCEAAKRPSDAIPASPAKSEGFNDRVGMDVKYLQGWKTGDKIPCLNIVDYGSSYQQMVPLPGRETGDLIRQMYRQYWLSWAGPPLHVVLDPSQPNLSEALCQACENEGSKVSHTAADAHWQLGKVERHGALFATVFQKVLAEVSPQDEEA